MDDRPCDARAAADDADGFGPDVAAFIDQLRAMGAGPAPDPSPRLAALLRGAN